MKTTEIKHISIPAILKDAFELSRKHIKEYLIISILIVLLNIATDLFFSPDVYSAHTRLGLFMPVWVAFIINTVITVVVMIINSVLVVFIHTQQKKKTTLQQAAEYVLSLLHRLIPLQLLLAGMMFLGFIFLIIPGIIISILFGSSYYFVLLEGKRISESLALSKALVRHNMINLFLLSIIGSIIFLLYIGALQFKLDPLIPAVIMPFLTTYFIVVGYATWTALRKANPTVS